MTGTVYETGRPGVVLRLVGQPPVGAKVYSLQKLRCNLCGDLFTAPLPDGIKPRAARSWRIFMPGLPDNSTGVA